MEMQSTSDLRWRVASKCDGGACVMVARREDRVLIGNTNSPAGPVSEFTTTDWRQFVKFAKQGAFDVSGRALYFD